jgi:hypothetical protein
MENSRIMSDHNTFILGTREVPELKSKVFRFEKSWIDHPEFQDRVERA